MSQSECAPSASRRVDTCPRCCSRALVIEGYRVPDLDRLLTQAFCTSCGLVSTEPHYPENARPF